MAEEIANLVGSPHIEIDADDDEGLGREIADSTTSLQSSVLRFELENGRRYHGFQRGAYAFPNDEEELDRMDLEGQLWLMLLGGEYHLAPLTDPQKILDLGTGTGLWAINMADKYPSAQVLGTDLSPVQPQFTPPNCQFQVDDFNQDWTWPDDSFDLIHGRLLLASVSDYRRLFQQGFAAIKPGGCFEMHDIDPGFYADDDSLPENSSAVEWGVLFKEACTKAGRSILPLEDYRRLMEDAGFVNIREFRMKRPQNVWPKDKALKHIAMYTLLNHLTGLHAFTIGLFTRLLGWTAEQVEVFCMECRKEWKDVKIHGYQKVIAIYGEKPGPRSAFRGPP